MVSKASDDLPEPLSPVMTTNLSRGMERLRFFRLCWRAPPILMNSLAMTLNFAIRASLHHNLNGAKCQARDDFLAGWKIAGNSLAAKPPVNLKVGFVHRQDLGARMKF